MKIDINKIRKKLIKCITKKLSKRKELQTYDKGNNESKNLFCYNNNGFQSMPNDLFCKDVFEK